MMTITTRHVKYLDDYKKYYWQEGGVKPDLPDTETIISIEADEAELDYILENFDSFPTANASPMIWKTPFAQFIYDNM